MFKRTEQFKNKSHSFCNQSFDSPKWNKNNFKEDNFDKPFQGQMVENSPQKVRNLVFWPAKSACGSAYCAVPRGLAPLFIFGSLALKTQGFNVIGVEVRKAMANWVRTCVFTKVFYGINFPCNKSYLGQGAAAPQSWHWLIQFLDENPNPFPSNSWSFFVFGTPCSSKGARGLKMAFFEGRLCKGRGGDPMPHHLLNPTTLTQPPP